VFKVLRLFLLLMLIIAPEALLERSSEELLGFINLSV
jgi:hypothetical protein